MENDGDSSASENFEESGSDELIFHDSVEARKDVRQFTDNDSSIEVDSKSRSRTDLVLDLRNVPPITSPKSDDETSEKLSAVDEQPEEQVEIVKNEETGDSSEPPLDKILRERINTLQQVIVDLKEEVRLALSLWRKERDEYQALREKRNLQAVDEATAAARAAAEAYAAESPLSSELGNVFDINPVQSLSELTILEYEKKLAKYQDALALAQAEKRYNMRVKMIANTYRQRIADVERMCNEELEKIRESTSILQPLRQMVLQWPVTKDGDRTTSDADERPVSRKNEKMEKRDWDARFIGNNVNDEVNMIPAFVSARFSCTEASKYDKRGGTKSTTKSQGHLLSESNSLPSTWYASTSHC